MSSLEKLNLNLPRSVEKNLEYRQETLIKCAKDPEFRARILEACRRDPAFWINTFAWTKDPNKPFSKIPFILYEDFQDDFIWAITNSIERGSDVLVEKTREMGVSWMVLYVFVWFWLFRDNCDFRVGSRKEDFVDKIGDMDTLIEKVRFCVRYLPGWMLPKDYREEENATYMKVRNPENGNTIIGESANAHFGSGGRRKAILIDEFAKWETSVAEAAWTSTHDVTKCRIVVSTPVGSGNKFAQLALGTKEKIRKITLHWTLHPEKANGAYYLDGDGNKIPIEDHKKAFKIWNENRQQKDALIVRSPWYDGECERRSESDVAQELDVDYLKSGHPFFSIKNINRQRVWELTVRKNPFSRVPYGFYIQGKIVNVGHKFNFLENQNETWIKIFELPKPYMEYVLGGDTAEGLEKGDENFGVIREKYSRNTVAVIDGAFPPKDFEYYCFLAGKFYNDALIAVENEKFGYAVNQGLEQLGANLYYTQRDETAKGKIETPKRGFTTDLRSRPLMLAKAEEEIRKVSCEVRYEKIISQMKTFIKNPKKGGRPEADGNMHDDGVIAFAIAGQVIDENPYKPRQESSSPTRAQISKPQKNAGFRF